MEDFFLVYQRKIHFVIFFFVITDLFFYCTRVVLHRRGHGRGLVVKILCGFELFLLTVDLVELVNSSLNQRREGRFGGGGGAWERSQHENGSFGAELGRNGENEKNGGNGEIGVFGNQVMPLKRRRRRNVRHSLVEKRKRAMRRRQKGNESMEILVENGVLGDEEGGFGPDDGRRGAPKLKSGEKGLFQATSKKGLKIEKVRKSEDLKASRRGSGHKKRMKKASEGGEKKISPKFPQKEKKIENEENLNFDNLSKPREQNHQKEPNLEGKKHSEPPKTGQKGQNKYIDHKKTIAENSENFTLKEFSVSAITSKNPKTLTSTLCMCHNCLSLAHMTTFQVVVPALPNSPITPLLLLFTNEIIFLATFITPCLLHARFLSWLDLLERLLNFTFMGSFYLICLIINRSGGQRASPVPHGLQKL